jgi:hypothetical protein
MDKDVTEQVEFGWSDGELLPIEKCVCGHKFEMWGDAHGEFSIGVEREYADECPNCHRKLYWTSRTQVFEVVE